MTTASALPPGCSMARRASPGSTSAARPSPRATPGPVLGVAFTPDGRRVATVSTDDTARLWLLDWGDLVRALRAATHACLTVDQRTTHLHESPDKARAAWEAYERRFGRKP